MIFRYPGAKNKLLRVLDPLLDGILEGQHSFHDVFVGGGSVLLHVAQNHPHLTLYANDLYNDLVAFWKIVVGDQVDELCERLRISPNLEMFYRLRNERPVNQLDQAFRAVFFNRCCFSGLSHWSPIGGPRQISRYKVFSRFNGNELIRDIKEAHSLLRGRTSVSCMDGAAYIGQHLKAAKYCDPPYLQKGDVLYRQRMKLADHLRLAGALGRAENWVLSYDRCPAIAEIYSWAQCHVVPASYSVRGKKTNWSTNEEFLITPKMTRAKRASF